MDGSARNWSDLFNKATFALCLLTSFLLVWVPSQSWSLSFVNIDKKNCLRHGCWVKIEFKTVSLCNAPKCGGTLHRLVATKTGSRPQNLNRRVTLENSNHSFNQIASTFELFGWWRMNGRWNGWWRMNGRWWWRMHVCDELGQLTRRSTTGMTDIWNAQMSSVMVVVFYYVVS